MSDNWAICVAPAPLQANTGAGTLTASLGVSTPSQTPVTFTITGMAAATSIQLNPGDGQPLPAAVTTDGSGNATVSYTYLNPGTYNASASNPGGTNVTWTQVTISSDLMPKTFQPPQYGLARGFAVYNSLQCMKVGLVNEVQRARQRLTYTEERQVELCLMTGQAGNFPYLAGPDTEVLTPGSGVLGFVDALGWLEGALGERLGAVGTIHASRYLAPTFAANWQVAIQGNSRTTRSTTVGTKVVFGSGYPAVGPDGKPPAAGTSWLYASGPVVVRRGPMITVEVSAASSATATNQVTVVTERQYVIEMDCPLLAVQCEVPSPPHLP